jgi:hypothetical protein
MAELRDLNRFEFQKVTTPIVVASTFPDFEEINNFTTSVNLLAGTYAIDLEVVYTNDDRTHKSIFRVSLDGGATWSDPTYTEVKDTANIEVDGYRLVIDNHTGGALNIIFQASKDNAGLVLEVKRSIITVERKLVK